MKTKRTLIRTALEEAFKTITVSNGYNTDLYESVTPRFIFPDDDPQLPLISFTMGQENITYQPGGFQDRYLGVSVRAYVEDPDGSGEPIENLIQDIEAVVESNSRLALSDGKTVRDIRVTLIDTDQGVLAPLGLAEIQLVVEY